MLRNSLIVIPFNLPWEWSTDYTNQTAFQLAKYNNKVICYMWSESFSVKEYIMQKRIPKIVDKLNNNIYLYYPTLFVPFRRFQTVLRINEIISIILLKIIILFMSVKNRFIKKIFWVFDPRTAYLNKYFSEKWFNLYDCVDYFPGTAKDKVEKNTLINEEKKLLKKADLVVANSNVLQNYLNKYRKDVFLVPQGFRVDSFNITKPATQIIKRGARPLIGYVGAINKRLDYKLLYDLALKYKELDFVLWGPVLEKEGFSHDNWKLFESLLKLSNVISGQSSKDEIPNIVKQFNVCIIPYVMSQEFNKYCYPMKIFEYFYLGKPVVSSNIPELKRFPNLVMLCDSRSDWEHNISMLLETKWQKKNILTQKRLAVENSWENKVEQICELIR